MLIIKTTANGLIILITIIITEVVFVTMALQMVQTLFHKLITITTITIGLSIATIIIMTITMLTKNTNSNQGSISNNYSHSEKDGSVINLHVLSQLKENNISKNNCNVKSRVHGSYSAKRNEWHMDASDIANITTIGPIFVQVNSNVNTNNNSLYILSTSSKAALIFITLMLTMGQLQVQVYQMFQFKLQKPQILLVVLVGLGASKTSIRNINSNDNMNYNSDKHGNRINDVSSNILTVTLKIHENTNNYSDTSLSNLLTINMNRNGRYNRNQKNNNNCNINKNTNSNESGHKYLFFVVVVVYVKYNNCFDDINLHQQITIIHYTNHILTSIFVLLFQMVIYLKLLITVYQVNNHITIQQLILLTVSILMKT